MDYIDLKWLQEIPKHWKIDRLKDCCERITGGGTPKSSISEYWEEGDIIWVTPTDFSNTKGKYISDSLKKITELGVQKSSANSLPKGTVIMSSRASIGDVKIAETELTTNQGFVSYIPSYKLDNNFLYYLIDCHLGDYFLNIASGTTFMEISRRMASLEYIPLPPKNEQIAIANYLDKACERIDKVIKIKEEQILQIRRVKKSRIEEAVKFGLDKDASDRKNTHLEYLPEINNSWKIDRFKDVASLRNDKTDIKSEEENYLELEDLSQGTGEVINLRNTLEVASKTTKFYKGDVLFGKLRPYLEKYAHVDFDGLCTGEILAFEPKRIEGKFLMYLISSNWFINLCNSMSYGAKMPRVNWNTQLSKIYLPIPSKEEQLEIIKSLDELSLKSNQLTKKIKNQIKTLKNYRKSLIHECLTGKKQVVKVETTQSI